MPRPITADQLDFGPRSSTPVISDTLRFVLPVPAFGQDAVFFNPDDRSYQSVRGDGRGVVIFSPVTEVQAERLAAKAAEFAADPNALTPAQFEAVLDFAGRALGVAALYDSSRDFVAGAMTRAGPDTGVADFGLYRRRREDLCQAVYVPGAGVFQGPAMTPQRFDDGAVIVRHGDEARLVQVADFEATYKHPDGRPLKAAELAVQRP